MSVTIRIPTPLRSITKGSNKIMVGSGTLEEVIESMENNFPGIKERICEKNGNIRSFVNIYIDGENIKFLNGINSTVPDKCEISIVPAVAGGK